MEQNFDLELSVVQLQSDVEHLQEQHVQFGKDIDRLTQFITGNGDPKKGLLWLVTSLKDMGEAQTKILADQGTVLSEHIRTGHAFTRASKSWQERLAYDVAKQAAAIIVAALLMLLALGAQTWVQSGGRPPVP